MRDPAPAGRARACPGRGTGARRGVWSVRGASQIARLQLSRASAVMSRGSSPQAVLDEIAALPRGDDLARLVHTVAFAAADERRVTLGDGLAEVAERAGLTAEDAET